MIKRALPSRIALLTVALCAARALCVAHGFDKQVQDLKDTDPAAIVEGKSYTVAQLKDFLALRATPTGDGYVSFTLQDLLESARIGPAYEKLAADARAEGLALSPADQLKIDRYLRTHVEREIFAKHIIAHRAEPPADVIAAAYEAQKEERFTLPERMVIRELNFPAAGEKEAQAAWKRLEAGEDFAVLQNEAPGDPQNRLLTRIVETKRTEREAPELSTALKGLAEDRKYSAPFRTAAGYAIVQRQLLIPSAYVPLDSVAPMLSEAWINAQDQKAINAFFKQVAGESRLLRIHAQNLGNAGALAFDSDVLISLGDREFTRGELRDAVGWLAAPDLPFDEPTFAEMALMSAPVQRALLDYLIAKEGLMESDEVKELRKAAEDVALARELFDKRFAAAPAVIDDAAIAAEAQSESVALTDETSQRIRKLLTESRRLDLEITTVRKASELTKFKPLIGFAARGT